jgi:membrane fusion protein (multidrug efflux system)
MSVIDDSVSAYEVPKLGPKKGWLASLWADKARLRRILMFWGVSVFLAIAGIIYLIGGRYVVADDSYVRANKLMVSTDVSGLVATVNVHEGQQVKAGDILFTLDPRPFEIALENAKANLASTVQDVESTRAMYRAAIGQIGAQAAQLNVNQQTFKRYEALAKQNAIAAMQVDAQHAAVLSAQATLASLQQTAATQLAKLNGNPAPARPYGGARALCRHRG